MTDGDAPVGRLAEDEAADADGEDEEINRTEEQIVLTASQEELGMKINQPDSNIRDSTARLHAVPSEKLRAWTGWLSKVGERADEWHWWLRSQIRFTVEMNELLRRAATAPGEEKSGGENSRHSDAVASRTTDDGEEIETVGSVDEEGGEANNESREVTASKTGSERRAKKVAERRDEESSSKDLEEGSGGGEKSEEARVNYKEGFWPIGTRWEPTSRMSEQQSSPSLSMKREPDKVPMPADETTMRDLIEQIVRQGVVYRNLYKHWSATGDQAVKEIVGRTVMPTDQVYSNGEEIPYCFYLEANSPGTNDVVEHDDDDDDAVLLVDEGRERISREFNYLYFNLSDKPARGG